MIYQFTQNEKNLELLRFALISVSAQIGREQLNAASMANPNDKQLAIARYKKLRELKERLMVFQDDNTILIEDYVAFQMAYKGLNTDADSFLAQFEQVAGEDVLSHTAVPQEVPAKSAPLHTKPYQPPAKPHRAYNPSLSARQPSLRVGLLRGIHQKNSKTQLQLLTTVDPVASQTIDKERNKKHV